MKITLEIQENKFETFIKFIETLDYVSIQENSEIPEWQQKEVEMRLEQIEKGEMKTRSWEEAKENIFKQ